MEQIKATIIGLTALLNMTDRREHNRPNFGVEEYCWTWSFKNYSSFAKTKLWDKWDDDIIQHHQLILISNEWKLWPRASIKTKTYELNDIRLEISFFPGVNTRCVIKLWRLYPED